MQRAHQRAWSGSRIKAGPGLAWREPWPAPTALPLHLIFHLAPAQSLLNAALLSGHLSCEATTTCCAAGRISYGYVIDGARDLLSKFM